MIDKVKIIPTISILDYEGYKHVLELYYHCKIDTIRVNMTRYEPEEYIEQIRIIRDIYKEISNGDKLNILLDIPLPGTKSRIVFDGNNSSVKVNKGDNVIITSSKDKINIDKNIIYVEKLSDIFNAKIGEKIFIDDGKMALTVEDLFNDSILLKVNNDGELKYCKSIYRENIFFKIEKDIKIINSILYSIKKIKPQGIILSFLEKQEQMKYFKELLFDNSVEDVQLIPKIETEIGISNLSDILNECDIAMLGRGDLGLTSDVYKVGIYQDEFLKKCKEMNKKCYIATDILNSIVSQEIVNRAEIVDVHYLLKMKVDGIISSGVIGLDSNIKKFTSIIESIEKEIL